MGEGTKAAVFCTQCSERSRHVTLLYLLVSAALGLIVFIGISHVVQVASLNERIQRLEDNSPYLEFENVSASSAAAQRKGRVRRQQNGKVSGELQGGSVSEPSGHLWLGSTTRVPMHMLAKFCEKATYYCQQTGGKPFEGGGTVELPAEGNENGLFKLLGPPGRAGPPGPPGNPGKTGGRGESGMKGAKGSIIGIYGPKGQKGEGGPPGVKGLHGDPGGRGSPGEIGLRGRKGKKGPPGPAGIKGDKGDIGTSVLGPAGGFKGCTWNCDIATSKAITTKPTTTPIPTTTEKPTVQTSPPATVLTTRNKYLKWRTKKCRVVAIGLGIFQKNSPRYEVGSFMKESRHRDHLSRRDSKDKYWETWGVVNNTIVEYENVGTWNHSSKPKIITLGRKKKFYGTGHLVRREHFYFHQYNTTRLVYYNLLYEGEVDRREFSDAWTDFESWDGTESGFPGNFIELHADEENIWAVYRKKKDGGPSKKLQVAHLSPDLTTVHNLITIDIPPEEYGACFIVCGVLYVIPSRTEKVQLITRAYDLIENKAFPVPETIRNGQPTDSFGKLIIPYNPLNRITYLSSETLLMGWSGVTRVIYRLEIENIDDGH